MELITGRIYTFKEISDLAYNPYRGILSPRNKGFIFLISSVDGLYKDKWDDSKRLFDYTGEGQIGHQNVNKGGNKAVKNHLENGKVLHVFEKPGRNKYTYIGEFYLLNYRFDKQTDSKGDIRNVVVFELKLDDDFDIPGRSEETEKMKDISEEKRARKLKGNQLIKFTDRANLGTECPGKKEIVVQKIDRDQFVKVAVNDRAIGFCELCGHKAPFTKKDGSPYLEVHHIVTLKENGPDTIYNAIALCPNCHRKMHYATEKIKETEKVKIVEIMLEKLLVEDELYAKAVFLFNQK
jgi:5-methylcytosine-specific restriction protein A